jgi:hypothetical protein
MSDLIGSLSKSMIRLAVVDPKLGLIGNLTINAANQYASENPGTTFLFLDGDNNLRYLSIGEVNKLEPKDLLRNNPCNADPAPCGSPKIIVSGGGGIGAVGNAVISQDGNGSLLAVDVVAGGYGYKYQPRADLLDACDIGSGAVLKTEIGSELAYEEFFDDIEEYVITEENDEPFTVEDYDVDGNPLGTFDATDFFIADPETGELEDPIQKEIENYQRLIREIKNPWWTTRTVQPGSISSGVDSFPQAYAVNLPADLRFRLEYNGSPIWTPFMDTYAISPVAPSNAPGSDYSGRLFVFNYELEFPYDGEYVFRGACDNNGKVYVDQEFVQDLGGFFNSPNVTKKRISKGFHRLRIDLLNQPIYEDSVVQNNQLDNTYIDVNFLIYGQGASSTSNTSKMFFTFSADDGSHSFSLQGVKRNKTTENVVVKVKPNTTYIVNGGSTRKDGTTEQGIIKKDTKNKEGGTGESNKIFADHILSSNDNDDIQVTASTGVFRSFNKRLIRKRSTFDLTFRLDTNVSQSNPISLSSSGPINEYIVFDTVDYIDKADRKLWRCNVYGRGGFINEHGICPFDTTQPTLPDNPYAGVHLIRWENIKFPVDGEYDIIIGVDDNVILYIGNNETGGNVDNNTGLRSIESGGDEYIIKKIGFRAPGVSNPVTTERIRIKAGTYRIRAELEQIPGGKFGFQGIKGINPMALAIQIKTSYTTQRIVSSKSWNQNPMGAALTIEAPDPPVPQEVKLPQIGRCPNNPIWSTRDPGAKYQWYPVEIPKGKGGNPYLNRYTMSPVKPLDTPGTDGSGKVWSNSWKVRIPFSGRYRLDGARADIARIKIDGSIVTGLTGVYTAEAQRWVEQNFGGWEDPKTNTINVGRKSTFVNLSEGEHEIEVELINVPVGQPSIIDESIFDTKDWRQASMTSIESNQYVDAEFIIFGQGVNTSKMFFTFSADDGSHSFSLQGVKVSKTVENVVIKVKPNTNYIIWSGSTRKDGTTEQGIIKKDTKNKEGGTGESNKIFADHIISANDNDDIQVTASAGVFRSFNKRLIRKRSTFDLTFRLDIESNSNSIQSLPSTSSIKNGITYFGPDLFGYSLSGEGITWKNFMNMHSVSPKTFDNIDTSDERIVGTFVLSWANVNFPETGQYDLKFAADNLAVLKIGGRKVAETTRFDIDSPAIIPVNVTQGLYTVEVELTNISNGQNIFRTNPSGVAIQITKRKVIYDRSSSWAENPMGISASLVAPPCPKPGGGVGIVTNIYPIDPGNGYLPAAPDGGYNIALTLTKIVPTTPGLGYTTGPIDVDGNLGIASVTAVGPNGEIQSIQVTPTTGFTSWPNIVAPNGFNADLTPVFEVIRDPLDIEPDRLIQVVDLVGLRQTGYVKGRAYYGAVFNKDGQTYAGYYETAGELVIVYATLQESIDAEVTTEPSAIQRFGTETNSNNAQLNIPNTPTSGTQI